MRILSTALVFQLFTLTANATALCYAFPRNALSERIAAQEEMESTENRPLTRELARALMKSKETVRIVGAFGTYRIDEGTILTVERTGYRFGSRTGVVTLFPFDERARVLPPETPEARQQRFLTVQNNQKHQVRERIAQLLQAQQVGNLVEVRTHTKTEDDDAVTYVSRGKIKSLDVIDSWMTDEKGPRKLDDMIELAIENPEQDREFYNKDGQYTHTEKLGVSHQKLPLTFQLTGPKAINSQDLRIITVRENVMPLRPLNRAKEPPAR